MPIVRSIDPQSARGYALILTGEFCDFWLGTGPSKDGSMEPTFSRITVKCAFLKEKLVHVAISFDGTTQNLYVDGIRNSKQLNLFESNQDLGLTGKLIVGGQCRVADDALCSGSQDFFDGIVEEMTFYSSALPQGFIQKHASASSQTMSATFKLLIDGIFGTCEGDCTVQLTPGYTPTILDVQPGFGWTGTVVTMTGIGFVDTESPTIRIGSRRCDEVGPTSGTEVVCTIQGPEGSSDYGMLPIAVTFPSRGLSLGAPDFLLTASLQSTMPSTGSVLGGSLLTVTAYGIPADTNRMRVLVGEHECHILSSDEDRLTCQLGMFWNVAPSSYTVTLLVDQLEARSAQILTHEMTQENTPIYQSFFVRDASNTLEISSTSGQLPTDAPPLINIGSLSCAVKSYTAYAVSCEFASRQGGRHHLKIRYANGFAMHARDTHTELHFSFSITAFSPTAGSQVGGQKVTISGGSFPEAAEMVVTIAGKKCDILTATSESVVVTTPYRYLTAGAQMGLERIPMLSLQRCRQQTACDASEYILKNCGSLFEDGVATSPDGDTASIIMVGPAGGSGSSPEYYLVDSDPSTVWHSEAGEDYVKIAVDLHSERSVEQVVLNWKQGSGATSIQISLGTSCDDLNVVQPWMDPDLQADSDAQAARFPVSRARVVVVELQGTLEGTQNFRIADLVILESAAQANGLPIQLWIGSEAATAPSLFDVSTSPTLTGVSPSSGAAGQTFVVSGSGFSVDCNGNTVQLGKRIAVCTSCGVNELSCIVPNQPAGAHSIRVHVDGIGFAKTVDFGVIFSQEVQLASVQTADSAISAPVQVAWGGGIRLTIVGTGFGNAPSAMDVKICGKPCVVSSVTDNSGLSCTMGPVDDVASNIGVITRNVNTASGLDEAYESLNSKVIVLGSPVLPFAFPGGASDDQSASDKVVYLRFTGLDIPAGALVSEARLHVKAVAKCVKGSVIRLWAEDADSSEPFDPAQRGSLGSRPRTSPTNWTLIQAWKWPSEEHESSDLSTIINEVISRPGWSSSSNLTLIAQQVASPTQACQMFGSSQAVDHAPELKLTLDAASLVAPTRSGDRACSVDLAVEPSGGPYYDFQTGCPREEVQLRPANRSEFSGQKRR